MLTQQQATDFAEEWLAAWNAHDIEAIMSHYADVIAFTSPFIIRIDGNESGTLHNKVALEAYFRKALEKYTDLHFELQTLLTGVSSVVLYYKSIDCLLAAEYMQLDANGKISEVKAHYLEIT